ncbi:MAG: HAD-IC family P-type ATPase [Sphingomonas sp.]
MRPEAAGAIAALRAEGLRVIMLTGDNPATAQAVARAVGGLDDVRAELRPEDKARIIGELKAAGARVAMAGDGINDAPALAAADVGLAMGTGTDVAIESAGITLTKGRPVGHRPRAPAGKGDDALHPPEPALLVPVQRDRVPVAAGVLYPVGGYMLSPMLAGAAMALSSLAVVTNALRLASAKLQ